MAQKKRPKLAKRESNALHAERVRSSSKLSRRAAGKPAIVGVGYDQKRLKRMYS